MKKFFEHTGKNVFGGIKMILPLLVIYSILLLLGSLYWSFFEVIAIFVFRVLIVLLTMVIAHKIAGKTTWISSIVIGISIALSNLGFFGAIFMALLIGFVSKLAILICKKYCKRFDMLLIYFVIPFVTLLISYLSMQYFVVPLITSFLLVLNNLLQQLSGGNLILLAGLLGFMTAFDLGGPVNKIAYTFALSAFLEGHYMVSSTVLVAATIPPLGLGVSAYLLPHRFSDIEKASRVKTLLFSCVGLTEGALYYVSKNPVAVMVSVIAGSTGAAMISAFFQLDNKLLASSLLGIFGTSNIFLYLVSHMVGVLIVLLGVFTLKKRFQN